MCLHQNTVQTRDGERDSTSDQEIFLFSTLTTLWRNCPSLITGACLFLALCLCFIWSGIENFRAAADLAGTTIFTFTGSLIGFRQFKHMRIGMAFVAGGISGMITAVGGGTVRTLLLGLDFNDLFWVNNADYLIAMIIGFLLAMFWEPRMCVHCEENWNAADRAALAIFAPLGAEKALLLGVQPTSILVATAALFGFLTGAGGGVLRDILSVRKPMALFTIYGWIAGLGATFHILLLRAGIQMAWIVSAIMIYLLAESTHQRDWRLRSLCD